MAVATGFQGRTVDVQEPRTGFRGIDLPGTAADAVFADAKALLCSSEARQMSESELERELHRRGQELVRKLLQEHHDQRTPGETAGTTSPSIRRIRQPAFARSEAVAAPAPRALFSMFSMDQLSPDGHAHHPGAAPASLRLGVPPPVVCTEDRRQAARHRTRAPAPCRP